MEIRKIAKEGLPEAMELVWAVFQEFEAPEYSQEGIDEFKRTIDRQSENMTLEMYGAYEIHKTVTFSIDLSRKA